MRVGEGCRVNFTPPDELGAVLASFAPLFTRPTWTRVQTLLCGVLLAPGAGTVTAALRALDLGRQPRFEAFHRILNRARWSARAAARVLLGLLVEAFAPTGQPLIFGLDETVERRRGKRITARAIYRDASRSSAECFQKTSGLRWMSVHLLASIPWAARVWALPFLTVLCPSERYAPFAHAHRAHKPPVRRARALIAQVGRWLPARALIFVADGGYSALELLDWCARTSARRPSGARLAFITRLRLDAALYTPAPARRTGQLGRPRLRGQRLPTLAKRLADPATAWHAATLPWYGAVGSAKCEVEITSDTALWYHAGKPPVAIRWVLIRDPAGRFEPQALLSTDLNTGAERIVAAFVRRWAMEATFEEAHAHLGLEGQRQWNDLAIARSTPTRLALFSVVALAVKAGGGKLPTRGAAWYAKTLPTFADALAHVRRQLWRQMGLCLSASPTENRKPTGDIFTHLTELLCYAA